jgi:hypothetical protein
MPAATQGIADRILCGDEITSGNSISFSVTTTTRSIHRSRKFGSKLNFSPTILQKTKQDLKAH